MDESMARDQTVSGKPSGASKSLTGENDLPDQLSTNPRFTRASSRKPTPRSPIDSEAAQAVAKIVLRR